MHSGTMQEDPPLASKFRHKTHKGDIDPAQQCRAGYNVRSFYNQTYIIPEVLDEGKARPLAAVLIPDVNDALEEPTGVCLLFTRILRLN